MAILSKNVLEGIREAEATTGYDPLPEGEYTVKVDGTGLKDTKSGTGQYIKVELTVLGPRFQGRKLFDNFNILNDSAEAMRIGQQQIKSLMLAGGMSQEQINKFNDTDQLMGLTFNVTVTVDEARGQYGPQNRIKSYKKANATISVKTPVSSFTTPMPMEGGSFSEAFSKPSANSQSWFK